MKETLLTGLFLNASFFLIIAALIIPLLRYLKIPVALGYLLAGVILGPYALGSLSEFYPLLDFITLKDAEHLKILAELGIVLLLFVIGLEITPNRLWQMRNLVFGLGGAQVFVSSLVIGLIAFLWGNNAQVSVLLGLSLALSSTAIVIQWIHEQKLFVTPVGRTSFSILLFQDLAVIPILLLLTIMSRESDGNIVNFVSISLIKMIVTVLAIYFIGKALLKPVFLFANKYGGAEVFVALILLVIALSASVASYAGLSMALGAFVAGLLLADTEYRHEVTSLIVPFKSMLLGIFFLSFGMSINLYFIADKPLWLFASVIGLMSIKALIIFVLCKTWKQTTSISVEGAILLSQSGEFGLLVVGGALTLGLMEQEVGQFMLITVGITMLIAPMIAPFARKIGKLIEAKSHDLEPYHSNQTGDYHEHIVIFGYGRIGKEIGNTLCQEGYKILGFEKDMQKINRERQTNTPVYLGDVSKKSTLHAANLSKALCVVVTLDDIQVTKNILEIIRSINNSVPIVIRAHNIEDENIYNGLDNVEAVAEDILIGKKLSEKVLSQFSFHEKLDKSEV